MSNADQLVDLYLAHVKATCAPTTLHAYHSVIVSLARWCDHKPWQRVTRDEVQAYLNRPRRTATGKPTQKTHTRDESIIRSFFTYLAGEQLLPRDELPIYNLVAPELRATERREPAQEWVWKTVWESNLSLDDRLWLGLGYFCGLRRREMATLAPFSVFARDSTRRGSGSLVSIRKGGGKQHGISYSAICKALTRPDGVPDLATRTDEWMDLVETTARFRHDMPFLLAEADHDVDKGMHTIWRHGRQLQDRLDIPREDQFSPHNLRHSAATNLALAGVPPLIIMKQLNHSSLEMTMHYINSAMLLDRWLDKGDDEWAM